MGVQTQTRLDTQLNGAITSIQTTATLDAAPAQTVGYGTFQRGAASEEDVYWAGLAGLQLTGMLRGLSRTALTNTEVVGNQYAHADNSAFEGTLLHYIVNNKTDADEAEAITAAWTWNTALPTSTLTPTVAGQFTRMGYVDAQIALQMPRDGSRAATAAMNMGNFRIQSLADPTGAQHAATQNYVDTQIAAQVDDQVDASLTDTTPGSLDQKITFNTHLSRTIINPAGDEDFRINTDSIQSTAGAANANQLIATDASGRLDSTFLSSPAPTITLTAAEAVTAGNAVALLPIEVEYFSQLTDANLALGDSNVRRRYAIRITPSVTTSTLTTMIFRAAEAVNASTTLGDLNISIQTDNAGEPSGTIITNGSANAITQVTQRTWNTTQANRTATWAAAPTLTAGTTYWIVFAVSATDAVNFLNLSVNSSHDENYVTFTRLTFDLDAGTWGGSATNATPFFWFNNQPKLLGAGVVPTDANWGARTWNFIGFARTTQAINTSVDVYYDIVPGQTGLRPGRPYHISETAGEIILVSPAGIYTDGTQPTAFTYRIGRAISTTSLKIERGQKRVVIRETTNVGNADVTRQYVLWFRPELVRVNGVGSDTNDASQSFGFSLITGTEAAVAVQILNAAAKAAFTSTSSSLALDTSGESATGDTSAYTDIGFTYTFNDTGNMALLYAILEAVQ